MNKKTLGTLCLIFSMGSSADYWSDTRNSTIKENLLEEELRIKVDCLASGDTGCDLDFYEYPYSNEISSNFSGDVSSYSNGQYDFYNGTTLDQVLIRDTSSLKEISIRYSGSPESSETPAEFYHMQNCEYIKSQIEEQHLGMLPANLQQGDTGIAFNENAFYTCAGSEYLDIQATSISGKVASDTSQGTRRVGPPHWGSGCQMCGSTPTFDTVTDYYNEKRYFVVTATPQELLGDQIKYDIKIDYILEKHKTIPVEEYTEIAPIDVSGITIFIPIPPKFPNVGYSLTTRANGDGYQYVTAKNSSEISIGCGTDKRFDKNMTDKSYTWILGFDEVNYIVNNCKEGFAVSFSSVRPVQDESVYWKVEYEWTANELLIWNKYASFLDEQLNDALMSSSYIAQLSNASDETSNDGVLLIGTLTDYIIGSYPIPENFDFEQTGLWGFLLDEAGNYESLAHLKPGNGVYTVTDLQPEIDRLSYDENNPQYGNSALNIHNISARPDYWSDFVKSDYATNVGYKENSILLTQAKNIIDISAGNTSREGMTTLQAIMTDVATSVGDKRLATIDKTEKFLSNVNLRTDIKSNLCVELNKLRKSIGYPEDECI